MTIWSYCQAVLKSNLPSTAKLVLLVLDNHVNNMGDPCFPSYATIANLASLSRKSVIAQVALAAEKGWIGVQQRPGKNGQRNKTNFYYLKVPVEALIASNGGGFGTTGERSTPVNQSNQVGERSTPVMVNDVHPELNHTELTIEQLQPGSSCSESILVYPTLTAEDKSAIDKTLDTLSAVYETKQALLDELAGAIKTNTIKRGIVPYFHSLAKAQKNKSFFPSLGIAVLAARNNDRQFTKDRLDYEHNERPLDPEAQAKGKAIMDQARLKREQKALSEQSEAGQPAL